MSENIITPTVVARLRPLMRMYRKTALTPAVKMQGPFIVETKEGVMRCENGWLALDTEGNPYPIDLDVFMDSYEEADQP